VFEALSRDQQHQLYSPNLLADFVVGLNFTQKICPFCWKTEYLGLTKPWNFALSFVLGSPGKQCWQVDANLCSLLENIVA